MFDTINLILLAALFTCLIIQLVYWCAYLSKPYHKQKKLLLNNEEQPQPALNTRTVSYTKDGMTDLFGYEETYCVPVSVIICAQDEDVEKLQEHFLSILEQDYPQFELIVVNDCMSEEGDDLLKRLKYQYKNFYFTRIPEGTKNLSRKKLGLSLGIKAAQYNTLLFTETDSYPVSKNWMKSMTSHFTDKKSIVLGFSVVEKQRGFMRKFAAFDYFFTNIQILCMAMMGRSFGANGRNLGYEKHHFTEQRGFSKHRFLQSGADDLFVNEIALKDNIAVDVSREALVETRWENLIPWKEWKMKRAMTKHFYKKRTLFFWRVESFSKTLFLLLFLYLAVVYFSTIYIPVIALGAYLIRLAAQLFVINKTAKGLKTANYYFLLPIFDVIQPFMNVYYYFYSKVKGNEAYTWNLGK